MDDHFITLPGEGPSNLDPFQGQHMYSPNPFAGGGRMPFGLGSLLMSFMGNRMWPIPMPNTPQGQFDAIWQRQHDMQMMQVARSTVSSFYPFQNMGGMNQHSAMTQVVSALMSQPDGIAASIMSPILGGNPVQAQMASYANLQGIATAGLGNLSGTSITQLRSAANSFEDFFYNKNIKPINKERGAALRAAIEGNIATAPILNLSKQDQEAMFNPLRNNEIVPGSTGVTKINRANEAIEELQRQVATGAAPEELMAYIRKTTNNLGDMAPAFEQATSKSLEETKGKRFELLSNELKGVTTTPEKTSDLKNLVDVLSKMQKEGKSQEAMQTMVSSEGKKLNLDEATIDKMGKAVKKGVEDGSKILGESLGERLQQPSIGQAAQNMQEVANTMLYHKVTRGVNYDNTLGFNYEDLLGARDEMLRSRLVGKQGQTLPQVSAAFGGDQGAYIPKLLDAARSAFGNNLTGKQLAQQVSKFVGYSNYDLTNPKEAGDLEDNLRTIKATARVTGIDYSGMMNIEEQAQNMVGLNPLTHHLGGRELGPMISEAALRTAAATASMSNQDVRYMGGSANIFRSRVEGAIQSAQEPVATQLAAMHTYFKTQGNDAALSQILKYAQTGDKTAIGWQQFQENIAKTGHVDAVTLQRYTQFNPAATRKGFQDKEAGQAIMASGGQARVQGLLQGIELMYGKSAKTEAEQIIESGDVNKLLTDTRFNSGEFAPAIEEYNQKGYFYDYARQRNPNSPYVKHEAMLRESIETSKEFEKKIAYKMGRMNAPTIQRIVQAIASGDVGEKGLEPIFKAIGISSASVEGDTLLKSTDALHKLANAGSVEDMMLIAGDAMAPSGMPSKITADEAKDIGKFATTAQKFGITADSIDKIIASKGDTAKIQKLISNKSLLEGPKAGELSGEIYKQALAIQSALAKGGVLEGYEGDFSTSSIRNTIKKPLFSAVVDSAGETADLRKRYDDAIINQAKSIEKIISTGPATTDPEKIAQNKNQLELAKTIEKLGGEKAYKAIEGIKEEQQEGGVGYEKVGDQYKLTENLAMFGQADGAKQLFPDEASAKSEVTRLQGLVGSSKQISDLNDSRQGVEKDIQKTKDQAVGAMDMSKGIMGILEKLPELTEALKAINNTLGHN